ncbi:3-phosphoshikimate 1-carboxyvinyltransferase [Bacillus cereus]|nr:3-phosphoshikimate 1-carboxyvinyltransferase [Bacillus cereus]
MQFTPDFEARSPWSSLTDVKKVEISPAKSQIKGEISISGSKSFTNRAIILAAMALGNSSVSGILKSDDSYWCIETLKSLGTDIEIENDVAKIGGVNGKWNSSKDKELYIGAAGTTGRFLPGLLVASKTGESWVLKASKRMSQRPIRPLITGIQLLGGKVEYVNTDGYFPLKVIGDGIKGGEINISGKTSSQFISGLIMASPYASQPVTINIIDYVVQKSYILITIDLMKKFGVKVEHDKELKRFYIKPSNYVATNINLEPDISSACYFFALAALTNGQIRVNGINGNSNQPDIGFINILEKMGCTIIRSSDFVEVIGPKQLKGNISVDMKEMSDQALTLAAIAPFADGPITITNVEHIRTHESDRLHVASVLLNSLGIKNIEEQEGITIFPGKPKVNHLCSFDDHRVAMAFSLIGAKVEGISIEDPGCVSKTFPNYYNKLEEMGLNVEYKK